MYGNVDIGVAEHYVKISVATLAGWILVCRRPFVFVSSPASPFLWASLSRNRIMHDHRSSENFLIEDPTRSHASSLLALRQVAAVTAEAAAAVEGDSVPPSS